MATAQLNLGTGTLTLDESADLSSLAAKATVIKIIGTALHFDEALKTPIGQIPQFSVQAKVEFADGGAWNAAGQSNPLTISVAAGGGGTLALIAPGAPLFPFPRNADGSEGQVQKARKGNADCPYLHIGLTVLYTVNGGANFCFGALGVDGSASANKTFIVDNYFPCDPSMPFADAIVAAFNAFVLPFNAAHASSMVDGAFLDYVFTGKIAFSAGLNYGLSLGAASLAELTTSFDSTLVTAGLAPCVKVGPSLDVNFEAGDAFRVIIGRIHSASQNLINLCVGKVDKTALGLDLSVGLSAGLGGEFNLQDTFDKLLGTATGALLAGLNNDAKAKVLQSLINALGDYAVSKYVAEAQEKIDLFLDKVNSQNVQFTASYEKERTNTQLFNYVVNCDVPAALSIGYPAAMRCDFVTAMRTDGVDWQAGSFMDEELSDSMAVRFQFFNVFSSKDVVESFQGLKTVYSGGGIFRLIFDTGMDWQSVFNGRSEDIKVFFEATAATGDQTTFRTAAITLNFLMTDSRDSQRAGLTANVLRLMNDSELTALANKITETVQVSAEIHSDACANLKFDPIRVNNRLNAGAHDNDKRNYEVFVGSVESIRPDDPFGRGLRRYENWVTFNRTATDQSGSTQPPDRAHSGNLSVWPQEFIGISDPALRQLITIDFEAGRQFMNLCEFLERLNDKTLDVSMTKPLFDQLLDSLSSAVRNSPTVLTWYSKACFLALVQLMSARVTNVKGPATPSGLNAISFELESQTSLPATSR